MTHVWCVVRACVVCVWCVVHVRGWYVLVRCVRGVRVSGVCVSGVMCHCVMWCVVWWRGV